MDTARRFLFHGHACAYSGRLYRPEDIVISSPASTAVSVSGGVSEAKGARQRFGTHLTVGKCLVSTVASFDDRKQALAMSHGRVGEEALASTTTSTVEVNDIVADSKRLRVAQVGVALSASAPGGRRSAIRLGRQTAIRDVTIDDHTLQVTLDLKRFNAADSFDAAARLGRGKTSQVFDRYDDIIFTTLVSELKWKGKPHPTAIIEGHGVYVPGMGRVYFGEMVIERHARRVTMLRLHLGSPIGLRVGFGDVGTNGSWYPPV